MNRTSAPSFLPSAQEKRRVCLAAATLLIATVLCYLDTLSAPFFFDDDASIRDNPTIRTLANPGVVLTPPGAGAGVAGRPMVNLSLAINYAIGGLAVEGYHLVNAFLHALAGLTLFGLVRRTLLSPGLRARYGPAAFPLAFMIAIFWSLHPLQTESVTCIIQRTEILVGLFYLLTLYAYARSIESPSYVWSGIAVATCSLGMASKEVMVSAPLMALLYDRTFFAGTFRAAWCRRRPLLLALAGTWLLLAYLVLSSGGTRGTAAGFGLGVSWWSYALKQCEAILWYLRLIVWPHPLVVYYGTDVVASLSDVWLSFALVVAAVLGTFWALWQRPVFGFVAMWFFAILAPSSSVVPLVTQTMAEHRMYLPLAAPLGLLLTAAYRVSGTRLVAGAVAIAMGFAVLTARRNQDYRTSVRIWSETVARRPAAFLARVNLGTALKEAGQPADALRQFQAALAISPEHPDALNALAALWLEAGRPTRSPRAKRRSGSARTLRWRTATSAMRCSKPGAQSKPRHMSAPPCG